MFSCLHYLAQYLPAELMYLQLYEHELGATRTIAGATPLEGETVNLITPLPFAGKSDIMQSNMTNFPEVVIINGPGLFPVTRTMFQFHGIKNSSFPYTSVL